MSQKYHALIDKCEVCFAMAWKQKPHLDEKFVISRQALFEIPLLEMKDHVDFLAGYMEEMLPSFEKDYHPQEPDRDPFESVRQKFR